MMKNKNGRDDDGDDIHLIIYVLIIPFNFIMIKKDEMNDNNHKKRKKT